ncbi:MAG TPA: NAD(P)/FAD-dependent oxidoreductase [Actinobacteria bacterium]|nr:dehydrosqualene desaturase [bacterium BMS3Bbin01]HDH25252.1 NAD(P)/FAD-dependent oxidoreductase [Actinomycetota bacterium]
MTDRYDIVIVGSGMNSLVCAAILARAGKRVVVLERNEWIGGCIRTEELFPGFTHDVLSSWYPLFTGGPAYAELADELHDKGLVFVNTTTPTGVLLPDGRSLVFGTDRAENVRRMNEVAAGDGDRFAAAMDRFLERDAAISFGLLGNEIWSRSTAKLLMREARLRSVKGVAAFFGEGLETCRAWLERDIRSDTVRSLIAPWVLHNGLGPDDAFSGLIGKVIIAALEMGGLPVVVGGSERITGVFRTIVEERGGAMWTGVEVEEVLLTGKKATGVRTVNGDVYEAADAVICNVTPTQLYGRLLPSDVVPETVAEPARAYRYGRADMQIHFALGASPVWSDPEMNHVALVHLTDGLDGVSRAVNEAGRGLLPARATVVVGQPTAVDPSRAPKGSAILWIQLQELPSTIDGDAAGEIDVPADGRWNEEVREAYADRIQARLAEHIENLDEIVVGRRTFSPGDLESLNVNLVGGDPYSGSCTIDQFLLWRPFPGSRGHRTAIKNVFHIGASTHPGPGLGGNSGYLVGKALS